MGDEEDDDAMDADDMDDGDDVNFTKGAKRKRSFSTFDQSSRLPSKSTAATHDEGAFGALGFGGGKRGKREENRMTFGFEDDMKMFDSLFEDEGMVGASVMGMGNGTNNGLASEIMGNGGTGGSDGMARPGGDVDMPDADQEVDDDEFRYAYGSEDEAEGDERGDKNGGSGSGKDNDA